MNKEEKIQYWIELAEYDFETAKAMLQTNRYLYVGFMCHQTIEKMLKAYYSAKFEDTPPYIHNLKHLANKINLYDIMDENQKDTIDLLLPLNIEARYPTYKEQILKQLSYEKCEELIYKTNELCNWIRKQL